MENVVTQPQECGGCGCVGYAFVQPQRLDSVFAPAEALQRGTLFGNNILFRNIAHFLAKRFAFFA